MVKATQPNYAQDDVIFEFDHPLEEEEEINQHPIDNEAIVAIIERIPDISWDIIEKIVSSLIVLKNISEKHNSDYIQILIGITNIPEDQIRSVVLAHQEWIDQIDVQTGAQVQIDRIKDYLDESDHPFVKRVLTKWWIIETLIEEGSENVNVNDILSQMLNNVSDEVIGRIMYYYFEIIRVNELENEGYQDEIIPL